MEMDSPQANPNLPLVCVGSTPNEKAWKSLTRPVDWAALLNLLDSRFAAPVPAASGVDINLDADFEDTRPPEVSPGRRQALLVGFGREHCLYLRTRLALAGMSSIVEEATVQQAQEQIARIGFNVVVVSLDMADADPWSLVETIRKSPTEASSVIVVSAAPTWKATEKAEQLGCIGLLEIPFSPPQVVQLLQKI
jgi:CheY-like chemotaxis protein